MVDREIERERERERGSICKRVRKLYEGEREESKKAMNRKKAREKGATERCIRSERLYLKASEMVIERSRVRLRLKSKKAIERNEREIEEAIRESRE